MQEYGGFEHNLQSLRTVDELEERYADFPGLNLTFETREGILKHCSLANARTLGELGERFLRRTQPSLEAQLANLADEVAYNNHDVDDGIRAGLITLEDVAEVPLVGRQYHEVMRLHPQLTGRKRVHETVRRMIHVLVSDVIEHSSERLRAAAPADIDAVRAHPAALMGMSDAVRSQHVELKQYLNENVYRHQRVLRMTLKARRVVQQLFAALLEEPRLLPAEYLENAQLAQARHGMAGQARTVADYIAGMTDRFAILEHRRLFDPSERMG
jgi:dGTPase